MSAYSSARRRASSYLSAMQGLVDVAAQAGRHRDQTLGVPREQVLVDARLVVEAVQVPGRDQLDEIAIAFLVFAEQDQVVVAVRCRRVFLWPCCATYTSQPMTGWMPLRLGGVVELDRAEQIAVIGHGDRGHLLLDHDLHQTGRFRRRRRAASSRCGNAGERKGYRTWAYLQGEGHSYCNVSNGLTWEVGAARDL